MKRAVAAAALALTLSVATKAAAADIVIAIAAPETGRFRDLAEKIRAGVERAVATLNDEGGVLGQRLVVEAVDDGCQAATGEGSARTLTAKAPALVVGHPCSSAASAAAPVYAAANILFITPDARHASVTAGRKGATVFRLAGEDRRQGDAAASWLLANAPGRRIAIVHDRTAYAKSVAEPAALALKAAGMTDVPVLTIVASRRDYSEIAAKAKALGTEALVFAGYPDEAAIILKNLQQAGATPRVLGSDSAATPEFAGAARAYPGGAEALLPANPGASLEARAEAAVEVWARAARDANTLAAPQIAERLRSREVETRAMGPLSFDEEGNVRGHSYAPAHVSGERWQRDDDGMSPH